MRNWFKNTALTLLIGGVALGIWRMTGDGHDLSNFVTAVWNVVYTIWDAIANVFVHAFDVVFGGKKN